MQKNSEFLREIIDRHQLEIFRLCFFLTQNKVLAEDLAQETFLRGMEKSEQLKDPDSALPWLKSIARSLFLDNKKSARVSKTHVQIEDMDESRMAVLPKSEGHMAALQVLSMMSEEERFILVLVDIQETSYEEAAAILKCPLGTVKSKLSRARQAFAEIFEKNGTKGSAQSS